MSTALPELLDQNIDLNVKRRILEPYPERVSSIIYHLYSYIMLKN